jgi:hypothetical protein
MNSFWTYIVGFLLGVISSFVVALFVEFVKRPRLIFAEGEPLDAYYLPPAPARNVRFVRVIISKQQLPWGVGWISRESAIDCRAEIRFDCVEGVNAFPVMPGRWASNPQPLPLVGQVGGQPCELWDQNIWQSAGTGISIPPGELELLDIASRFDDEEEAFGWSNASYLQPLWRSPTWKLKKGCYTVIVTIRAGGQKWTDRFDLHNDGSRGEMRLKKNT